MSLEQPLIHVKFEKNENLDLMARARIDLTTTESLRHPWTLFNVIKDRDQILTVVSALTYFGGVPRHFDESMMSLNIIKKVPCVWLDGGPLLSRNVNVAGT